MDQKASVLMKALEAAPTPIECDLDRTHPSDVQRWAERYKLWYQSIRNLVLEELSGKAKNNFYYQLDRLIEEADAIKKLLQPQKALPPTEPMSSGEDVSRRAQVQVLVPAPTERTPPAASTSITVTKRSKS